eukprot:CAMPEP_0197496972 /NCGR_PEP_ID=MMETSP1311-20131121/48541_1 /TAXON_ID=464262 /ORGANISM="Genus nov. species nov., Strain RCC856" /LENGTH=55 /DNA_ID=CAMNT_0043042605 /DNA_START=123 /DNA_END=286 /DNA_ORIENTATION=+
MGSGKKFARAAFWITESDRWTSLSLWGPPKSATRFSSGVCSGGGGAFLAGGERSR